MEFKLSNRCQSFLIIIKSFKLVFIFNFLVLNFSFANDVGLSGAHQKLKGVIRIGVYEFAPHVIVDSSLDTKIRPQGAVIDFINAEIIKKKIYESVEIRVLPFGRTLEELASGQLDMAVALAKNPEREKKYKYFHVPFTEAQAAIILKASDPIHEVTSLKILTGKTLGHVAGSVTPSYLAENEIKIDYISGDNYHERNLARLRANRIDGFYVPTYSNGRCQLSKVDQKKEFKILKLPVEEFGLYFAFRKDYRDDDIKRLEKALTNIERHYETYLLKYY